MKGGGRQGRKAYGSSPLLHFLRGIWSFFLLVKANSHQGLRLGYIYSYAFSVARGEGRGETVPLAWVGFLCPVLQVLVMGGRGPIVSCSRSWVYETQAAVRGHQSPLSDTFQGCGFRECVSEEEGKESK